MKSTDIRIDDLSYSYEDFRYRTPIKFGGVASDRVTVVNVACTVCPASILPGGTGFTFCPCPARC